MLKISRSLRAFFFSFAVAEMFTNFVALKLSPKLFSLEFPYPFLCELLTLSKETVCPLRRSIVQNFHFGNSPSGIFFLLQIRYMSTWRKSFFSISPAGEHFLRPRGMLFKFHNSKMALLIRYFFDETLIQFRHVPCAWCFLILRQILQLFLTMRQKLHTVFW